MNPQTTETPTTEPQPQDQEAPRQWMTPSFERVSLNEALLGLLGLDDGDGLS